MNVPRTEPDYFDSEDLIGWLLLNPEISEFDPVVYNNGFDYSNLLPVTDQNQQHQHQNQHQLPIHQQHYQQFPQQQLQHQLLHQQQQQQQLQPLIKVESQTSIAINNDGSRLSKKQRRNSTDSLASDKGSKKSNSKKRERESIDDMEARIKELTAENSELQAHLMTVTQRTTEVQKQRSAMEKLMASKLDEVLADDNSDQSELAKVVQQYTEIYADYGKCRQREVRYF